MLHLMTLLAVLGHSAAWAQAVYRWVDESGRTHFGDRPPTAGAETLDLEAPAADPAWEGRRSDQTRVLDALAAERREREDARRHAAEEAEQQAALHERNCGIARNRVSTLERGGGVYRTTADGDRQFIDDQERDALLAEARRAAQQWCR